MSTASATQAQAETEARTPAEWERDAGQAGPGAGQPSLSEAVAGRYFPGSRRAVHHGRARYGEALSGSDLVVEFMQLVGAEVIFGIPGGASLPLNDAFTAAHEAGAFRYVLTGHEQGAAFEAAGYAGASGRAGFCTATSGPGATNLITGLADAFRDSRPVLAFTGNTPTSAEREAFQAIDIVGLTAGKATKASYQPRRPEEVQALLVEAYHTAVSGRPGSVLFDLPKDVQVNRAPMRPWEEFLSRYDWALPEPDPDLLAEAARLLAGAHRPLLYVGHGAVLSGAAEDVRRLSRHLDAPVATTVHGLGILPARSPLNLGMIGMHGTMGANLAAHLADVVLALGARFDDRVVGARPQTFAAGARIIHVDLDATQLNRVRRVDVAIHGDVRQVARQLLEAIPAGSGALGAAGVDRAAWLARLEGLRQALPTASYDDPAAETLSHEFVYGELSGALGAPGGGGAARDVIATFDVGTHQMKGAQWFPVSRPRSFLTSGGMGSMGCALPMAVGAWFARPEATVFACVGDGGFVMSSHELDTIGGYGIPVKIVLFDDSLLGMVTNWHSLFFGGRKLTSDRRRGRPQQATDVAGLKETLLRRIGAAETADDLAAAVCAATAELAEGEWPLFAATGAAYGIPSERVHTKAQYRAALSRALDTSGPYLIHVVLPTQAQVYPLIEPGSTPQDIIWRETAPGSGVRVYAREHFDFEAGHLRPTPLQPEPPALPTPAAAGAPPEPGSF
ncbi:MAG TPA: thiamine pyrophosphate-dependent enzyme [Chloroflexota bacterium]|nr:thiamine pyrophosphate-dependent enzyme [Chloroflexota bacterium]